MRLRAVWSVSGRQRRKERAYARFLEATIGLIDESTKPHTTLARHGRIEMSAAILRVAEADRVLRAALDPPGSTRRLEDAMHELDEARCVLEEAARITVCGELPPSSGPRRLDSLTCSRCGAESPPDARGWRAYLLADDTVGICCPACAHA